MVLVGPEKPMTYRLIPLVKQVLEQATSEGKGLTRVEIAERLGINPVAKEDGPQIFGVARAIDSLLTDGVIGQAIRQEAQKTEDRIVFYATEGEERLINRGVLSGTWFVQEVEPDHVRRELTLKILSPSDLVRKRQEIARALAERLQRRGPER